jgi:ADP-ribose pyrophosphatase YjhB (NUDIX family)
MRKKKRIFCPYCGSRITQTSEEGTIRDFCKTCGVFFYENPLPVVSAIVVSDRKILLVKRGKRPYKNLWCLPTGFAESGESIEEAALRELEEETGIKGQILSLIDVESCTSYFYGDLLFIAFEVEQTGGVCLPGSDTVSAKYFPIEAIPKLAFSSNEHAVRTYIRSKAESWAIIDSFASAIAEDQYGKKRNLLSDSLVEVIEKNAETIAWNWVRDARTNRSTPAYHRIKEKKLFEDAYGTLSKFSRWLRGHNGDVKNFYMKTGMDSRKNGFSLSEVLSALSLVRRHIWDFALSRSLWQKTVDIYMVVELETRIILFFDKAAFHTTRGYEMEQEE